MWTRYYLYLNYLFNDIYKFWSSEIRKYFSKEHPWIRITNSGSYKRYDSTIIMVDYENAEIKSLKSQLVNKQNTLLRHIWSMLCKKLT